MAKRVALISGVGRTAGLGYAIAKRLAAERWDIALTYWAAYDSRMQWGVEQDAAGLINRELVAMGSRVISIEADLQKLEAAAEIFERARRELEPSRRWFCPIANLLRREYSIQRLRVSTAILQ